MLFNLIDKNCAKILLLFTLSPGRNRNRKEIKEIIQLNNIPLDVSLNKLLVFNILIEKKKIYSLNLENSIVKTLLEEKQKFLNLPLKVQFILIETIDFISRFKPVKNIILFGSYSKLIFTDKSDIDIAVILQDNFEDSKQSLLEKRIFNIMNKLSKKNKKEIEVHYFKESDLKHKEDPLIKDIVRNGRELI